MTIVRCIDLRVGLIRRITNVLRDLLTTLLLMDLLVRLGEAINLTDGLRRVGAYIALCYIDCRDALLNDEGYAEGD